MAAPKIEFKDLTLSPNNFLGDPGKLPNNRRRQGCLPNWWAMSPSPPTRNSISDCFWLHRSLHRKDHLDEVCTRSVFHRDELPFVVVAQHRQIEPILQTRDIAVFSSFAFLSFEAWNHYFSASLIGHKREILKGHSKVQGGHLRGGYCRGFRKPSITLPWIGEIHDTLAGKAGVVAVVMRARRNQRANLYS
jgi:hypothetical protein